MLLARRIARIRYAATRYDALSLFPSVKTPSSSDLFQCSYLHTSSIAHWRSREERRLALHRKDDDPARLAKVRSAEQARSAAAHRTAEYSQESRVVPRRLRTGSRKDQVPLGLFSEANRAPSTRAETRDRPNRRAADHASDPRQIGSQKAELRAKVKQQLEAVKDLPPLTDQDFKDIYEDLISYDAAPASPNQLLLDHAAEQARLSRSQGNENKALSAAEGPKQLSVRARIDHLQARLLSRLEAGPTAAEKEDDSEDLLKQLKQESSAISAPAVVVNTETSALDLLDSLLPISASRAKVASNLATVDEWEALLIDAARRQEAEEIGRTLQLMQRAGAEISDEAVQAAVHALPRYVDLRTLQAVIEELGKSGLPLSPDMHQSIIATILRNPAPQQAVPYAERYLRQLEEASTPAPATSYALVLSALFKHRKVLESARQRAWNLFGHARLVAHPVPSVKMYNAMIYSCSLDDRIAPERALDLFSEMVEQDVKADYGTYHALIRTCARSKEDMFYFEALRLLKELLDRNFKPEKDVFDALLEGAKPRADLARAKWIVGNMITLASRGNAALQPDHYTIANLFLTYATYKPPPKLQVPRSKPESERASGNNVDELDSSAERERLVSSDSAISADPQPLASRLLASGQPSDSNQILAQTGEIMSAILQAQKMSTDVLPALDGRSHANPPALTADLQAVFSKIPVTTSLLNGYLAVLVRNSPSSSWYSFFFSAYSQLGLQPDHASWDILFSALEKPMNARTPDSGRKRLRVQRTEHAREAFAAWRSWIDEQEAGMLGAPEAKLAEFASWRNLHVELQWARTIAIEAKSHKPFASEAGTPCLDAAMGLLDQFVQRYPPEAIVVQAERRHNVQLDAERESASEDPGYLVQMSSFLYPETSDLPVRSPTAGSKPRAPTRSPSREARSRLPGVLPHLTFEALYPLYHRFIEIEDRSRAQRVKDVARDYARALEQVEDIKSRRNRGQRAVKDAKKRLIPGLEPEQAAPPVAGPDHPEILLQDPQERSMDARSLDQI